MDPVEVFNGLPAERVEADLLACCASPRWARRVAAGRPYPDRRAVLAAAEVAARDLAWADVQQALAGHPRIGQRPTDAGRAAAWSRREQAGVAADAAAQAALAEANQAYERRFGHVFLVCAGGRSATELLAAARARLGNDPVTERAVVTDELSKITLLRLERLLDEPR